MKASGQSSEIRVKCCVLVYQRPWKSTNHVGILSDCPPPHSNLKCPLWNSQKILWVILFLFLKPASFEGSSSTLVVRSDELMLPFLCFHLSSSSLLILMQLAGRGNKDNKCSVKAVEEMLESMQITMSWCPHPDVAIDPSASACPYAATVAQ